MRLIIFENPFYFIEYGIAQLASLQLWSHVKEDGTSALVRFNNALALGGGRPLSELFAIAGLDFDFSEQYFISLIEFVKTEISEMNY